MNTRSIVDAGWHLGCRQIIQKKSRLIHTSITNILNILTNINIKKSRLVHRTTTNISSTKLDNSVTKALKLLNNIITSKLFAVKEIGNIGANHTILSSMGCAL